MKELIKEVGLYCRKFREEQLKISLTEFCNITNQNIKNVNAFEYGRANNIKYLFYYYNSTNEENKITFASDLFNIL